MRKWVIGAVLAGAAAGITTIVSNAVTSGASTVEHAVTDSKPRASSSATVAATAALPFSYLAQYAPPLPDYNNVWVLPNETRPASDAISFSSLGLISGGWAPGKGGIPAHDANYEITISGGEPDGLTITNIAAHIIKRSPALAGTLIDIGSQGMNANKQFLFDLSKPPFEARYGDPTNQAYGQPVFDYSSISLAKAESMTINIEVTAPDAADYQFDLQFTVALGNEKKTYNVAGPDNKPFEVTGLANAYPEVFTHSSDFTRIISLGPVSDCPKQCP